MTSANHAIRFGTLLHYCKQAWQIFAFATLKSDWKNQSQRGSWQTILAKSPKKQLRPWVTDPLKTWKVHSWSWSAITKEILRNVTLSIYEIDNWTICGNITRNSFSDFGMSATSDVTRSINIGSVFDSEISAFLRFKTAMMNELRNETFQFDFLVVAYCMENTE